MADDQWELRVCVECFPPRIAKRQLVMKDELDVSKVYYCPEHGPLSISVVVDTRGLRARREGEG